MLTSKIHHIQGETYPDAGAEVIIMHPDTMLRIKPAIPALHKISPEQKKILMPAPPTAYLRPKKHDYL